jgi:protein-tyrosine-phosphatase/DNA-binding HxlR family transcriptional regulator
MSPERNSSVEHRAAVYAALGDVSRLRIVDTLMLGDAAPSELAAMLQMPSNLLAHHLNALESAGLVERRRSEGDGRRSYLHLRPDTPALPQPSPVNTPPRMLFVCTGNSARSHLAAALWRRASTVPATSAGTHPVAAIDPGAIEVARRRGLPMPRRRPRHLADVLQPDDLVVAVCDLAHEELAHHELAREELAPTARLHWSVADPVRQGKRAAFDAAFSDLADRVDRLAGLLPQPS